MPMVYAPSEIALRYYVTEMTSSACAYTLWSLLSTYETAE
jgi:hypothetical protein